MNLTELNKNIKAFPNEDAILNIIEQKINDEMNILVEKMNVFTEKVNSLDKTNKMMMWVVGVVGGILTILLSIIALK